MRSLIGLTGYARSGKDTAAVFLRDHLGFKKYAFADALRRMAIAINPTISLKDAPPKVWDEVATEIGHIKYVDLLDAVGYEMAKEVPDFRRFLQGLGTDGVRETFGEDAWVDALDNRLTRDGLVVVDSLAVDARIVISDVRFPNEVEYIHDHGGEVWRVSRPGVGGADAHASEANVASLFVDLDIRASNLDELFGHVMSAGKVLLS